MALDLITYTKNNGAWTKTITNSVADVPSEIYALQQQVIAFNASQAISFVQEVADAIANYNQQILVLQAG